MDPIGSLHINQPYPSFNDAATLQLGGRAMPTTKEAATQFEALFVQHLIQTMRETVRAINPDPMLGGGQDSEIFMSMFDQELAKGIAADGGLGLANSLMRQLDGESSSPAESRPIQHADSLINLYAKNTKS